ncbi:hypothetical protein KC341_g52 [Hortaea werneckii]|nr:hypothetical protein KC341_g52 [Hortaea werneckii]
MNLKGHDVCSTQSVVESALSSWTSVVIYVKWQNRALSPDPLPQLFPSFPSSFSFILEVGSKLADTTVSVTLQGWPTAELAHVLGTVSLMPGEESIVCIAWCGCSVLCYERSQQRVVA